jgi:Holliday junction resolvase
MTDQDKTIVEYQQSLNVLGEAYDKLLAEKYEVTDENEHGVPMNEYDAQELWRRWLGHAGIFTGRIENIGTSLPDIFMLYKAMTVFQECKVRRSKYVYAPKYQVTTMLRMSHELHPWQLIYVVYNKAGFDLYEFKLIRELTKDLGTHGGFTASGEKIRIEVDLLEPFLRIDEIDGIEKYLDIVHFRAFKKYRRPELQIGST